MNVRFYNFGAENRNLFYKNMRSTFVFLASLSFLSGFFYSCEKQEGEGGDGSIVGRVYKIVDDGDIYSNSDLDGNSSALKSLMTTISENNSVLNKLYGKKALTSDQIDSLIERRNHYTRVMNRSFHFGKDTIVGCDEDVFIIYGNHEYGFDDKVKTSYDGTYRFDYLNDGNYKIFAYNDNVDGKSGVVYDVKVDGGEVYGGDFYINDGKNANLCGVVGYMEAIASKGYEYMPGVDQRVYLREENSVSIDDCRVDGNGLYVFPKLKPNTVYYVWSVTEDGKNEGVYANVKKFMTGEAGSIVPGPILQSEVF